MRFSFLSMVLVAVAIPGWVQAQSDSWLQNVQTCQILDGSAQPTFRIGFDYVADADVEGFGETGLAAWDARWEAGYFHDVLMGDIDIGIMGRYRMLTDSAGMQLPDQLAVLAADVGWTWRYVNATALQLRAQPGVYSDMERIDFNAVHVPFSAAGVFRLLDSLSAIAGVSVRLGFERVFMPICGFAWEPIPEVRVAAMLPESRVDVHWTRDWSTHARLAWESESYRLDEKGDFDRERITLEDYRGALGATRRITDEMYVVGEAGMSFERTIEFQHSDGLARQADIDPAVFLRIAVAGPF